MLASLASFASCCCNEAAKEHVAVIAPNGSGVDVFAEDPDVIGDQSVFRVAKEDKEPQMLTAQAQRSVHFEDQVNYTQVAVPEAASKPPDQPIKSVDEPGGAQESLESLESLEAQAQDRLDRLQAMPTTVAVFAQSAELGCPCTIFEAGSIEPRSTRYWLDGSSRHLIFGNSKAKPDFACPVKGIKDVYTLAEDGPEVFPKGLLSTLPQAQKELLLYIIYEDADRKDAQFYMIEHSNASLDTFLTALRILANS